jgi:hypothetical protein
MFWGSQFCVFPARTRATCLGGNFTGNIPGPLKPPMQSNGTHRESHLSRGDLRPVTYVYSVEHDVILESFSRTFSSDHQLNLTNFKRSVWLDAV